MMKEISFALYAIKKNIQNSAELRSSFLANVIGMCINNTSFIIIWGFFIKSVGVLGGWTVVDIIGLQGFTAICFGLVFAGGQGIKKLAEYISSGSFDRFMLSPKNLISRIATSSLGVSAIGDVIFGILCLVIYTFLIHAGSLQIFLLCALSVVTTIMFFSAALFIYSLSFFFTDATRVADGAFDLFFTPSLFNGGAFQGAMRFIFTFLIPSLLIGTLPVEVVRDLSMEKFFLVCALTVLWLFFSINFFYYSVRRYESANFMTFGS